MHNVTFTEKEVTTGFCHVTPSVTLFSDLLVPTSSSPALTTHFGENGKEGGEGIASIIPCQLQPHALCYVYRKRGHDRILPRHAFSSIV